MKRAIIDELKKWKMTANKKPLIIKGARQVGKTFIMKEFGQREYKQCHYFNFEQNFKEISKIFERDFDPNRIISELEFVIEKNIHQDSDLLIFDEIQEIPKALTSLKYFQEKMPNLDIMVAGSLLGVTLNSESFPVGKVSFLDMYPMTFEEFLLGIGEEKLYNYMQKNRNIKYLPEIIHNKMWEKFKVYLITGGLPEVVQTYVDNKDNLLKAFNEVRKKQNDLVTAYQADMAKHSGKENALHIERLWQSIPSQLAKELDGKSTKFILKKAISGIRGYARLAGTIDWLKSAGLIIKVDLISKPEHPLKAFSDETSFKLYMFDVGILGALSNLPYKVILDYDYGSYKGYYAENVVAQEFNARTDSRLYYWKGRTSEIEFIRCLDDDIVPIEVKAGKVTRSKSLSVYLEKYNTNNAALISAKNLSLKNDTKVKNIPLYWLANFINCF